MKIAVLDDYQHAAEGFADWSSLDGCETTFFHEHIADRDALVQALQPFEIVCAMRERTAFPREVLERLPNLKFMVTTGPFNAVIDIEAAAELGITISGTLGTPTPTPELTWALILALARQIPREDQRPRELGGGRRRAERAADRDAELGRGLDVDHGVEGSGRHHEPEVRQALQHLTRERCALAHRTHDLKRLQRLDERVGIADVLMEERRFAILQR